MAHPHELPNQPVDMFKAPLPPPSLAPSPAAGKKGKRGKKATAAKKAKTAKAPKK